MSKASEADRQRQIRRRKHTHCHGKCGCSRPAVTTRFSSPVCAVCLAIESRHLGHKHAPPGPKWYDHVRLVAQRMARGAGYGEDPFYIPQCTPPPWAKPGPLGMLFVGHGVYAI